MRKLKGVPKDEYKKGMTTVPNGQTTIRQFEAPAVRSEQEFPWNLIKMEPGSRISMHHPESTPITPPIQTTIKQPPIPRRGYGNMINDANAIAISSTNNIINKSELLQSELEHPVLPGLHDAHRLTWVFSYEGAQPTRGAFVWRYWFKDKSGKQYGFHWTRHDTIQTWPKKREGRKKLEIWIHHPLIGKNRTEPQQLVWAKQECWRILEEFGRHHGIAGLRQEKGPNFAEWIVKNKKLDDLLRPYLEAEPDLCWELLHLKINKISHPDKIEKAGKTATDEIMYMRNLLIDGTLGEIFRGKEDLRWLLNEGREELKTITPIMVEIQQQNLKLIRDFKVLAESVRLIQYKLEELGKP